MDIHGYAFNTRSKSPGPGCVAVIEESRSGERQVIRAIPTRDMARTLDTLEGDPVLRSTGPGTSRVTACCPAPNYGAALDIASEVAGRTAFDRRSLGEIGPSGGEIPAAKGYTGFPVNDSDEYIRRICRGY